MGDWGRDELIRLSNVKVGTHIMLKNLIDIMLVIKYVLCLEGIPRH